MATGRPSEIATDTDLMNTDLASLKESLTEARNQLEKMVREIEELDRSWDGPANDRYVIECAKDYESSNDLFKTVDNILECMSFARKEYDKCEMTVAGIISSISV